MTRLSDVEESERMREWWGEKRRVQNKERESDRRRKSVREEG